MKQKKKQIMVSLLLDIETYKKYKRLCDLSERSLAGMTRFLIGEEILNQQLKHRES